MALSTYPLYLAESCTVIGIGLSCIKAGQPDFSGNIGRFYWFMRRIFAFSSAFSRLSSEQTPEVRNPHGRNGCPCTRRLGAPGKAQKFLAHSSLTAVFQ